MKRPSSSPFVAAACAAALCLVSSAPEAKVKYETQHDKTVNFATLKTWAWHPSGTGEVKLALTPQSDPDRIKKIADPIIVAAVEKAQHAIRRDRHARDSVAAREIVHAEWIRGIYRRVDGRLKPT